MPDLQNHFTLTSHPSVYVCWTLPLEAKGPVPNPQIHLPTSTFAGPASSLPSPSLPLHLSSCPTSPFHLYPTTHPFAHEAFAPQIIDLFSVSSCSPLCWIIPVSKQTCYIAHHLIYYLYIHIFPSFFPATFFILPFLYNKIQNDCPYSLFPLILFPFSL